MSSEKSWSVGPETVRMLELGHPWVIADSYTKRWPTGQPGQIIPLCDTAGRFLATAMLDPQSRIVARILSRQRIELNRAWLRRCLERALALRQNHADLHGSNAWRLVNAEGDGLPGLAIDRYGDYVMLQSYCSGWGKYLKLLVDILKELLAPRGIYEKGRPHNTRELEAVSDTKSYGRLLWGTPAPEKIKVRENDLCFLVDLEHGLNTGLFLDQRRNRKELMQRCNKKRVLNLFAYTGAFSVAAASAGARQVTSVDASAGYTEWAKNNFTANNIPIDRHEFLVGDCLKTLLALQRANRRFDIVLLDPPSFSTTATSRFTTRGGTTDIIAASLPLLEDGGLLIASSNHQKVDVAEYLKELRRGALLADNDLRVVSLFGQPEDFPYPVTFPEGRYLKYAVCTKVSAS